VLCGYSFITYSEKRVKVLHVEGGRNLYGGAHQILLLIEGLQARGISNAVVCRADSPLSIAAGPFAEIHGMPMAGDLDVGLIGRLYRVIRRTRPDIVHLHSRIGADVMGGIAARLAGVPVVHSRRLDNPESRLMVALKYKLHDRVIAISDGISKVLLSEGLPPGKLRCVRDAIDASPYRQAADSEWFCREFALQPGVPVIGVVAQLIERKGHRVLLDAMPELLAQWPGLQVLFFGKGPLASELGADINRRGLTTAVRLAGFRDDLPRILPCLSMVVHPAFMEGLGVSLLQASSSGVPVIASAVGGIPEAVRDQLTGLLVPPGDAAALAGAIARLLTDETLARRMGEAGRSLVDTEFSADLMIDGNLGVYQEVLGVLSGC
jgi:glycosyltransferase involved in cell wall biosynthesis